MLELQIGIREFNEEAMKLIEIGEDMINKCSNINDYDTFNSMKIASKEWSSSIFNFLERSFSEKKNEFAIGFHNSNIGRYTLTQKKLDVDKRNLIGDVKLKLDTFDSYRMLINICDRFLDEQTYEKRVKYSMTSDQVIELILSKLYELYGDYYYSIHQILKLNGIILSKIGEEKEYAQIISDLGYVDKFISKDNVVVRLNLRGKLYVEREIINSIDYSNIGDSYDEVSVKLDEILSELNKQNLGQEIIFDELSSMKELYNKLNKQNWGQLLKGKLFDLLLSNIISPETVQYIYQELTNEILRLK